MAKRSTIRNNWPKYLLQWGTLAAIIVFVTGLAAKIFGTTPADPEAYCPMGGLQALATYGVRGSLPCSMSALQIAMGIALAACVILFSKLFCAYLCPVGTVEDLLYKLRDGLGIKSIKVRNGSFVDKLLRIFKYFLLFWIFYNTLGASELYCKNLDPYYAVATGFKGEITLWMSITTLVLTIVFGFMIDRFWCRYFCPLGALSNTLKFWLWVAVLGGAWYLARVLGLEISWVWLLGAACVMGYLLEVICGRPKLQAIHMLKNESLCVHCGACDRVCPYHIDITSMNGKIDSVDCTLCGECSAVCRQDALHVGMVRSARNGKIRKLLPAVLTVVLLAASMFVGNKVEIPTISETWGEADTLATLKIENLTSVHCYGSSMAFKARLEKIPGTHGVKTYVKSHTVVIDYDPKTITAEKLTEEIFVPSHCRIVSPDVKEVPEIKVVTIRTEKMFNASDLNNLANQFRFTYSDKQVYGLDSEYDCPLIVHLYMHPDSDLSEAEIKEIVEKKTVDIVNLKGELLKQIPVDFEYVRMDRNAVRTIRTTDYLEMMFDGFDTGSFNGRYTDEAGESYVQKRDEHYAGVAQYVYEIEDQNYEKPIYRRSFPFLSNWLSSEEGVISMKVGLNKAYKPAIMIRFTYPMTADRIWEMLTAETWKITYSKDDVREIDPKMKFETPGVVYPYEEE